MEHEQVLFDEKPLLIDPQDLEKKSQIYLNFSQSNHTTPANTPQ